MKINKYLFSISLSALLLLGTSCNKWLDLAPLDGITRQEFWKTKEDVKAAVTGVYSSLFTSKSITETVFFYGELRADMLGVTASTASEYKDIMDVNILPTNSLVSWASLYRTINSCNIVLEYAPAVKDLDPTFSEAQLNGYLGEMLALRSLMYFYLTRTFGDIPLKTKATSKDSDLEEIGKTQQDDVLKQLIADLKLAQTYLPATYSTSAANYVPSVDKGRITLNAATTLLADIYLWRGNYSECIKETDKVMAYSTANPDKISLISSATNAAWWQTIFGTGSSRETIFEFAQPPTVQNPFYSLLAIDATRKFLASDYVISSVFPLDPLNPNTNDVRAGAFYNAGDKVISKWGTSRNSPSYSNWQVYRYSDLLMIRAEALATQTGGGTEALQIIATLRASRGAIVSTLENPDPTDSNGILNYILHERAREFAFEGKRWFDLLRFARRNNYANINLLSDMASRTVAPALQQTAVNKYKDPNSHYLPINQTDLFADTKLQQNPFYN